MSRKIEEGRRQLHVQITDSQYAELERIAKEQDRSVSYIVKKIIDKALEVK